MQDLEKLSLKEPLLLKAVKSKSETGSVLTAIQLVFTNGIESPLFNGLNNGPSGLKTDELSGNKIKKILHQGNEN